MRPWRRALWGLEATGVLAGAIVALAAVGAIRGGAAALFAAMAIAGAAGVEWADGRRGEHHGRD